MNQFFYQHHDGRNGEAYSPFAAFQKALGKEAPPLWKGANYQPTGTSFDLFDRKGKRLGTFTIVNPLTRNPNYPKRIDPFKHV